MAKIGVRHQAKKKFFFSMISYANFVLFKFKNRKRLKRSLRSICVNLDISNFSKSFKAIGNKLTWLKSTI